MKKTILLTLTLLAVTAVAAKVTPAMYYVQLKDKQGCGYSISNPLPYLSQRAIDRRVRWNIPVDSTDLPVSAIYTDSLAAICTEVYQTSRWMNGALVYATDSQIATIRLLGFVDSVEQVRPPQYFSLSKIARKSRSKSPAAFDNDQNHQVGADSLYAAGFRGRGVLIAVIDAGFPKVNELPGFDSLRSRGGILGTFNVVTKSSNVFCDNPHGTCCLSTMAFNLPNEFIGTAPDADYWLIRSEVAETEYLYEPDLWVIAAEIADSAGADIISSSLGYYRTDDGNEQYTYQNMNGRHFRSSRAATLAAEKGLVVCVSAGNEGDNYWHYITTPADADSILSIGGVDISGDHVDYSSYGPTSDGRIKPEVCALATNATVARLDDYEIYGNLSYGDGTSVATPIVAGTIASLMSAFPDASPSEIRKTVLETASQSSNPDNTLGYGIPNGWRAYKKLLGEPLDIPTVAADEPGKGKAFVSDGILYIDGYEGEYMLYSPSGFTIGAGNVSGSIDMTPYPSGIYILKCGDSVIKVLK